MRLLQYMNKLSSQITCCLPKQPEENLAVIEKVMRDFSQVPLKYIVMQLSLFLYLESPKSYISEDAESPCPTDPNTMDVDVVGSLPTMVNQPCKSTKYFCY